MTFSGNVYQLARLIQQDVNHTGGLRALLGDAVKINASARNLAERSRRFDSLQPLRDDFLELDREWQLFSRRVDSTYGLRNSIRTQLRKCDDLEKQLEQLFQVEKQIDRNALAGVATEIASHLRNLKEDIEIEIGDTRQGRAIMAGIRSVYDQNRRVAYSLRNRDPYETLLPEYEHLNELWTPVANSLRGLNDRHIQRHMLRIDEAERTIRKLMLLPEKFDVAAVLHQADQVHQSVETMLGKVTLRALTDLPSSHIDVIEAADNLRSTCTDFTDCARSGDDQSTLAELYHYLEDDWQRVNTCVGKSRREPVIAAVGQVQHSIDTLRDLLGVQLGIDRRDIVEKAAMLDQMAKNFDRQIRSYMSRPNRYPRQFQIDAMKASASFYSNGQPASCRCDQWGRPKETTTTWQCRHRTMESIEPTLGEVRPGRTNGP